MSSFREDSLIIPCEHDDESIVALRVRSESLCLIIALSYWNKNIEGDCRPEDQYEDKHNQVCRLHTPCSIGGQDIEGAQCL